MSLSASDAIAQSLGQILDASQIVASDHLPAVQRNLQQVFTQGSCPCIVYPQSQEQLAEVVRWANKSQKKLLIMGGGSKVQWGNVVPATDVIVSTQRINRIIDHAVGDLTVTVEAGISFSALQTQLNETGQMIALDPTYPETATIGGILATRDAGSLRQRYGSVRDMCLGLSFVRADGERAKAGGRVVKNVAGYDLMKLFTGSFGTLGIISEATLRLYPIQEVSQTLLCLGAVEAIAQLTHTILDSTLTPVAIDVLSKDLLTELDLQAAQGLAVRFQSLTESVVAQVNRLKTLSAELDIVEYKDHQDTEFWQQIRQPLWSKTEAAQTEAGAIAKFGLLPSQASRSVNDFSTWAEQKGLSALSLCHAGSGLGLVKLKGEEQALVPMLAQLRSHCEQHQGFLTLLEAPMAIKHTFEIWGYSGNGLGVMKQLKDKFDPHHLLNSGRFVGGL